MGVRVGLLALFLVCCQCLVNNTAIYSSHMSSYTLRNGYDLSGLVAGDVITLKMNFIKTNGAKNPSAITYNFVRTSSLTALSGQTGYPSGSSFPIPTTTVSTAAPTITWTAPSNGNYRVLIKHTSLITYIQQFEWTIEKNGSPLAQIAGFPTRYINTGYKILVNSSTTIRLSCVNCTSIQIYKLIGD